MAAKKRVLSRMLSNCSSYTTGVVTANRLEVCKQ